MRKALMCSLALYAAATVTGCAKEEPRRDRVRVRAPFVDVRVGEDGDTEVKAPGTHVRVAD